MPAHELLAETPVDGLGADDLQQLGVTSVSIDLTDVGWVLFTRAAYASMQEMRLATRRTSLFCNAGTEQDEEPGAAPNRTRRQPAPIPVTTRVRS